MLIETQSEGGDTHMVVVIRKHASWHYDILILHDQALMQIFLRKLAVTAAGKNCLSNCA